MHQFLQKIVSKMEDEKLPLAFFFVSFLSVVLLRFIGEGFSEPFNYLSIPFPNAYFWSLIHSSLSYFVLGLGLVVIFKIAAKIPVKHAARFIMSGFIIIFLTPLFDLMLSPFIGWSTANFYIHSQQNVNIPLAYFTFYGGFAGMSLGLHLEILIIIVAWFSYFYLKKIAS